MPRPNKPRSIGAEDRMRANVARLLEEHERSIPWLARKMGEAGCPIDQASLWKSLRQDRKILVDEALAVAAVFDVPLVELIGSGHE